MTDETPPIVTDMEQAVDEHGEVHAVVEGHDGEVELRRGQTTFDQTMKVVRVTGPDNTQVFAFDSFVRYYKPLSIFHE